LSTILSIVEKGCVCFAFEIEGMNAKKVKIKNITIFLVLMIMLNFESVFSLSK
jgi:hypothetical protein